MRFPFVSRRAYDNLEKMLEATISGSNNQIAAAAKRAELAEVRASEAVKQAADMVRETRIALTESYSLARQAGQSMFPADVGDVENPPSVAEADRAAARKRREAQEAEQRKEV